MCKVHSAVHLILQFQALLPNSPFPFPIYGIFGNRVTDEITYAFSMKVSFDIQYI